jgi:hypothetical protein
VATVLDELVSRVRWDTDPSGLKKARDGMKPIQAEASRTVDSLNSIRRAFIEAFAVRNLAAGARQAAGFVLGTAREFETLRARMIAVTGSSEAAGKEFERLKKFAETTPFNLDKMVEAFSMLKAVGIEPTTQVLHDFGNVAAANGRDISDLAMAVRGAVTGEFEMLKGFNVIARVHGEQLAVTFRGRTKTIGRDARSITEYLQQIGQTDYAAGMSSQMDTLNGKLSNLEDAAKGFAMELAEAGPMQAMKDIVEELTGGMQSSKGLARMLGGVVADGIRGAWAAMKDLASVFSGVTMADVKEFFGTVGDLARDFGNAVKFVLTHWRTFAAIWAAGRITSAADGLAKAFANVTTQTDAATKAQKAYNAAAGLIGLTLVGAGLIMDHYAEKTRLLRQETEQLTDSVNKNRDAFRQQFAGMGYDELAAYISKARADGITDDILEQEGALPALRRKALQAKAAGHRGNAAAAGANFLATFVGGEQERLEGDIRRMKPKARKRLERSRKARLRIIEKSEAEGVEPGDRLAKFDKAVGKGTDPTKAMRNALGEGKPGKEKDNRSQFQKDVDARIEELAEQAGTRAAIKTRAYGGSTRERSARQAQEAEKERLRRLTAGGDFSVLGGEFRREKMMMRDAGLFDEAARAAPPVLTVSITRYDVNVDAPITTTVKHANATAADIGRGIAKAVDEVFRTKVRAAIQTAKPAVAR